MPKLLFITTTNLSTNPRLLKELKLANKNGYECTFIGFKLGNWSDKTEDEHLKSLKKVKAYYLSSTKSQIIEWLFSTIVWKLSTLLSKYFRSNLKLIAYAHNKRSWQITRKLKSYRGNYDLVIAHNLGVLYPASRFAKKQNVPFAFDIEDYHPGEKCSPSEKHRRELIMQKLLPKATYISYASPLIRDYSLRLINEANTEKGFLINNSFSGTEFQLKEKHNDKIQIVWFSQNITWGRGLEQMVPALAKFKDKLQFSLIGNKRQDFHQEFLIEYDDFINYLDPLPQKELNLQLSEYDIGLAIEISNVDLNKDIALSNKIFACVQAGLFILATDTSAQKQFIEEHNDEISDFDYAQSPGSGLLSDTKRSLSGAEMTFPNGIGSLSGQSTEEMGKVISNIIDNIKTIRANKKTRFEYAKKLAWEYEGEKLLKVWDLLL